MDMPPSMARRVDILDSALVSVQKHSFSNVRQGRKLSAKSALSSYMPTTSRSFMQFKQGRSLTAKGIAAHLHSATAAACRDMWAVFLG